MFGRDADVLSRGAKPLRRDAESLRRDGKLKALFLAGRFPPSAGSDLPLQDADPLVPDSVLDDEPHVFDRFRAQDFHGGAAHVLLVGQLGL